MERWWENEVFGPLMGGGESGGKYGYTGTGADGVAQVSKRVPGVGSGQYDAHESEFVFDADSTQAIGPKLLTDVMAAAKAGRVDVNKIREAIGMSGRPGAKTGGTMPVGRNTDEGFGYRSGRGRDTYFVGNTTKEGEVDLPGNISGNQFDVSAGKTTKTGNVDLGGPMVVDPGITKTGNVDNPTINMYEDAGNAAIGKLRGVMEGTDQYYQTQRDRVAQDLGGAGTAATAAMRQRGAAAGMTGEGIETMQRTRQRDVEGNVGQALTDMAESQQEMAIGAASKLSTISQWGQNFEFLKEKYGDEAGTRMANDASKGMGWPSFHEKYPDATWEDWSRMQKGYEQGVEARDIGLETSEILLENMKEDEYGSQLVDHVDKSMLSDPNYVRNGEWKNDQAAMDYLANYWKTSGMEGEFNPGNAEHMAWAEKQMNVFGMSEADAGIAAIRNEGWFQELPESEKARYEEEVFPALSMLSSLGGITVNWDDEGNMELLGPDGEIIYPPEKVKAEKDEEEERERYGGVNVPEDIEPGESFVDGDKLYEYKSDDSIEEITYTADVDDPFGVSANNIVEKMGYESKQGKIVARERADAIASGEYKDWTVINGKDDPVYQNLLNDNTLLSGKGSADKIDPSGGANEYHVFNNLEKAEDTGNPIKIDGRVAIVVSSDIQQKHPDDHKRYVLVDIATGQTMTVRAPKNVRKTEGAWLGKTQDKSTSKPGDEIEVVTGGYGF